MTHLAPHPSSRPRGITLIEVAMVLAIAAVVVGGVMTLYLSTSHQRKITDTSQLVVSAVQKISDLMQGKDMKEFTGQVAVAFGVLPASYKSTDDDASYNLPINNVTMTFGVTAFGSGRNFAVITVGSLSSDACIALGKLNLGDVVPYVTVDTTTDPRVTDEPALAAQSIKDAQGEIPIAAIAKACAEGSYIHYYLTN